MRTTTALQATGASTAPKRVTLQRRDLRADDVAVRVTHCGVCHSDLHALRSRAGDAGAPPLVPGHEMTGVVAAVGEQVSRFAVGQRVAVGNIVDSCGECAMCRAGQENFCVESPTLTYGGLDRVDASTTQGGWAGEIVVGEAFTYALPDALDPAAAAPLMCAGITVWEPLRALGVGPATRVGVVGLGGLGHLAVKLAAALGARVTVLTRSAGKADDARALGATDVLVTTDDDAMTAAAASLDVVVDTVSAPHDPTPLLALLGLDGALCWLGDLGHLQVDVMSLLIRAQASALRRQRRAPRHPGDARLLRPARRQRRRRGPARLPHRRSPRPPPARRRALPLRPGHHRADDLSGARAQQAPRRTAATPCPAPARRDRCAPPHHHRTRQHTRPSPRVETLAQRWAPSLIEALPARESGRRPGGRLGCTPTFG